LVKQLLFSFILGLSSLIAEQTAPEKALKTLIDGNKRYIENKSTHPNRAAERRLETAKLQEPFAVILGCADSRVSPEILFDQGIGDLFVVRVAGNVVSPVILESIEFSALYLHSSIILVLGHENCGAVNAVLKGTTKDIETIAGLIGPAIEESKNQKGDRLENAIKDNVNNVVKQLRANPALAKLLDEKKLGVIGGYYNFHSGEVEIIKQ